MGEHGHGIRTLGDPPCDPVERLRAGVAEQDIGMPGQAHEGRVARHGRRR